MTYLYDTSTDLKSVAEFTSVERRPQRLLDGSDREPDGDGHLSYSRDHSSDQFCVGSSSSDNDLDIPVVAAVRSGHSGRCGCHDNTAAHQWLRCHPFEGTSDQTDESQR